MASKQKSNKEVISNNAVKAAPTVVVVDTKAAKARVIFDQAYADGAKPVRKDLLVKVQKEAGLTPAGSATYLQNYKRANGLSVARV